MAAKPTAEKPDPWKHRGVGIRCRTCMFFVEKVSNAVQRADHLVGRCRRRCPTLNGYPVVFSDDWCGDHKLDEEAV